MYNLIKQKRNHFQKSCSMHELPIERRLIHCFLRKKVHPKIQTDKNFDKTQKLNLKLRNMSPFYPWKISLGSANFCCMNFIRLYINAASLKNIFYKKLNCKLIQKLIQIDEKAAKNYMRLSQKHFQSHKIIHWTQRMIKKLLLLSENLFLTVVFLNFAF